MRPGCLTHWFKLISKLQPKITFWFTTFSGTPVFREHLQAGTVLHKVHKHMFNYSMDVINSMLKVKQVLKRATDLEFSLDLSGILMIPIFPFFEAP